MSDSESPGNIFTQQSDYDENVENVYFLLEFIPTKKEWPKWANRLKLIADEAIPLMNGLDPVSWMEYLNERKDNLPIEMIQSIKRCLKIAKADGFEVGTPTEWLAWGRIHDLDKPILKSDMRLDAPNTCMFILFESAVNEISKSSSHASAMKKVFKNNKIKQRNQAWQEEMEGIAAEYRREGKISLATKASIARKIAQRTSDNSSTIERNTKKTW